MPRELAELTHCQAYDFGTGRDFKLQVMQLLTDVDRAIREAKQRQNERSREALRGIALRPYQYLIWVLFVFALIALSVFASLSSVPSQIHALGNLWIAEAAESKGDYSMAISQFRNVLGEVPTSREAKLGLAIALFSSKSPEAAADALTILQGITIDHYEWDRLAEVMPTEYQTYFQKSPKP